MLPTKYAWVSTNSNGNFIWRDAMPTNNKGIPDEDRPAKATRIRGDRLSIRPVIVPYHATAIQETTQAALISHQFPKVELILAKTTLPTARFLNETQSTASETHTPSPSPFHPNVHLHQAPRS